MTLCYQNRDSVTTSPKQLCLQMLILKQSLKCTELWSYQLLALLDWCPWFYYHNQEINNIVKIINSSRSMWQRTNIITESKIIIHCIVPDPCDREPCNINADCEREGLLSANFTCSCRDPFTDGDGFNCSSKIRL